MDAIFWHTSLCKRENEKKYNKQYMIAHVLIINSEKKEKKCVRSEEEFTEPCYIDGLNDDCMLSVFRFLSVQQRINTERGEDVFTISISRRCCIWYILHVG